MHLDERVRLSSLVTLALVITSVILGLLYTKNIVESQSKLNDVIVLNNHLLALEGDTQSAALTDFDSTSTAALSARLNTSLAHVKSSIIHLPVLRPVLERLEDINRTLLSVQANGSSKPLKSRRVSQEIRSYLSIMFSIVNQELINHSSKSRSLLVDLVASFFILNIVIGVFLMLVNLFFYHQIALPVLQVSKALGQVKKSKKSFRLDLPVGHALEDIANGINNLLDAKSDKDHQLLKQQQSGQLAAKKFEFVCDSAKIGTWSFSIESERWDWSSNACEILGTNSEKWYSLLSDMLIFCDDESVKAARYAFDNCLRFDSNFDVILHWHKLDQSKAIRMLGRKVDTGGSFQVQGFVQDIESVRRLEEKVMTAQKHEAVARITGGIAHDFNNILTVIIGNVESIKYDDLSTGDLKSALDVMEQSVEQGSSLVKNLITIASQNDEAAIVLSPNGLIKGMSKMLSLTLGDNIQLAMELDESCSDVKVNKGKLESAIINFAMNAKDAIDGSGTFRVVTLNNPPILSGISTHQHYIAMQFHDNGAGIRKEIISKVVDPFFTTKEKGEGSGLGLSMINAFASQSGGELQVNSTIGKGSVFTLYLPKYGDIHVE